MKNRKNINPRPDWDTHFTGVKKRVTAIFNKAAKADDLEWLEKVLLLCAEDKPVPKRRKNKKKLDEKLYAADFTALAAQVDKVTYTPALKQWLRRNRKNLIAHLEVIMPWSDLKKEWARATREERLRLIDRILRVQCALYSTPDINFKPSKLYMMKRKRKGARGKTVGGMHRIRHRWTANIHINEKLIDDDDMMQAVSTAHHEQVHAMLLQLATATYHGDIGPDHPLYDDALIKYYIKKCNSYVSPRIFSVYRAQSEEKICRTQQQCFIREYKRTGP